MPRKWGTSLTHTVGSSEAITNDGDAIDLAGGQMPATNEPRMQQSERTIVEVAVDGGGVGVDALIQETEDSIPGPQSESKPADEIEAVSTILLCVVGCLNGLEITF